MSNLPPKEFMPKHIGINPMNDGNVIRLTFPQLTEERRKELAKGISKRGEEAKIAVRNIRRDAMDALKKQKKAGELTEDDLRDEEEALQKMTDKFCKEINEVAANKTKEVMSV